MGFNSAFKGLIKHTRKSACPYGVIMCRGQLKCDGTRAETRFRLSAKRTSPFKSVGASVQSTTGSRGVHISGSNAGYNMFRASVKSTGYPLNSPFSLHFPSRASPCAITFQLESTTGLLQSTAEPVGICNEEPIVFPMRKEKNC